MQKKKKELKNKSKVIGMIRKEENKPICMENRNWKYISFLFY